jgi:HSP20 family protein
LVEQNFFAWRCHFPHQAGAMIMIEITSKTQPGKENLSSVLDRNSLGGIEDPQFLSPNGLRWRLANRPHIWRPPTDVYETDDHFVVRVEIAGMRESDFSISLEERHLLITGLRADPPERRAYYQMEIPFGEFSTEIELPGAVVPERVEAFYREGFLKVVLPKARPHFIHATVKE